MSDFSLLSADMSLWDPSTKATCGLLDICPAVTVSGAYNHAKAIDCPLPGGDLGNMEKPHQDMAFLLIAPVRDEWVFSLTAMWKHPHQV